MIEVKNIRKSYTMGDTAVHALDDVSLRIEQGEFVAIMGPSGSGKSTLMHLLGLLDMPDSGSYELHGNEVSHLSEDQLAALRSRTIGFVFQQFNLLARTSARENVGLPMVYATGKQDVERIDKVMQQVGLGNRLEHRPNELSGGQQQRVAIARAMVNYPSIIFADEPTGNLDSASERDIMALLMELNRQGITVVLVTHEPEIAKYVRRVIKIRDGKIQSDERQESTLGASGAPVKRIEPPSMEQLRGFRALLIRTEVHFKQAGRALLANKIRSLLSMLGILIGVAAIIAMLALGRGARESVEAQLSSLGSNLLVLRVGGARTGGVSLGSGALSRITMEDYEAIRPSFPAVKRYSPTVNGRAQVDFEDHNWNTQILGSGTDYPDMRAAVPIAGRFFTESENAERARVAVIGATIVRELFGERNPIGETMKINRISFQVIGVLPVKGSSGFFDQDDMIVIPVNTAMRRVLGKRYLDSIDIEVGDPEKMEEVQESIEAFMNVRHRVRDPDQGGFQIRNMADIQEALSSTSRIMSLLLASIASISLLVGGIGVMNIMLVSVSERTREIGLRKALGATRGSIRSQFLVEAIVISFVGGMTGILLGVGLAVGLARFSGWATKLSWESSLMATVFSAAVGILFGYWPARKASDLHPIEALRHE